MSAADESRPLLDGGATEGEQLDLYQPPPNENKIFSCRYRLAYVAFLGFFIVYALRVNLSVGIVKMGDEFDWTDKERGQILAAFFYGYILTQIPGGLLATKIGSKWVYGLGIMTTTLLTLVTPLVAKHTNLLIAVRIVEGIGEGVTFPAMHAMWARWAPPRERSRLCSMTYSGAYMGTVVSLPVSGFLADGHFLGGWPAVFYIFGAAGIAWFLLWVLVAENDPRTHPNISDEERDYIVNSIAQANSGSQKVPVPWSSLATSPALWAIITAHTCNNWGFYTLLTCLPTFFNDVLQFDIKDSGFKSAVPYLLLFILSMSSGYIADYFIVNRNVPRGLVRKIFNTLAFAGAAGFLILTSYVKPGENNLAVGYLTLSVGMLGLAQAGFNVNHLDIGPRFGGVLMGITNTVATIPGFVGPVIAGILTPCALCDKGEYKNTYWEGPARCPPAGAVPSTFTKCSKEDAASEWRKVFFISSAITVFGMLVFILLGSGKVQRWNTTLPGAAKMVN